MNPNFGIYFEPVLKSLSPSLLPTKPTPKTKCNLIPVSTVNNINNALVPMHSEII